MSDQLPGVASGLREGWAARCTAIAGGSANFHRLPQTVTEVNSALDVAVIRAAVETPALERFVSASSEHGLRARDAMPDGGAHLDVCGLALGYVRDVIRQVVALAPDAPLPIFRDATQTRTITYIDNIADGIVTAMGSPAALREDFQHLGRPRDDGRGDRGVIWVAWAGPGRAGLRAPADVRDRRVVRRRPDVEKARRRLGGRR